jgi:hypothetical protein
MMMYVMQTMNPRNARMSFASRVLPWKAVLWDEDDDDGLSPGEDCELLGDVGDASPVAREVIM